MPGPLPGQTVTAGTIFGLSQFGTSLYGIGLPPEYLVEPMVAASISYTSVLVTWSPPSGVIFRYRLLRNRYGFPVNENDGDIIYDTAVYPGNAYTDLDVSPGTYHYYGFYVLVDVADNIWIRSGFAGCLAVQDYATGAWLFDLLPEYFTTVPSTGSALTDDAAGNSQLQLFLNVFGWALDYLRTQYAAYANHLNDAWFIPLDELWDLAQQVGLTFSPDVPAYTVRKATENFAHVAQQRGTLAGIAEEIALRTGYGADVHMGPNILLDDDQAQILSPVFLQYEQTRCYAKDECCWVPYAGQLYPWLWNGDGWFFRSLVNNNTGNTPPSGGSSNSYWGALYDSNDFLGTQNNIATSNPGTWEVLDTGATNYVALPHSATQGLGVLTPPAVNSTGGSNAHAWNALRMVNQQGSARTLWCRSVSRTTANLGQIPDSSFEAGTTLAPPAQVSSASWVPQSWPQVTCANWMGGTQQVSVPAYWTPANATLSREDTVAHTGSWAMEVTPTGTATPITTPSAVQYANPGFEGPSLTGWSATFCTISQATEEAHTGKFSLQVAPDFTVTTSDTGFEEEPETTYTPAGNPFVTGPQITAIPAASDTVTCYCYGTENPAGGAAFPSVIAAIQYYDINGNVLATTEGSSVLLSAAWTSVTCTATAPAGAVAKALVVTSDPAETANINNWFIDDITWAWTVSESWAQVELNSPWITCPGGTACTASAWYQASAAGSSVTAELIFYDQAGNTLGTNLGSTVTGTASTWVNPTASGTAPSGTAYAALNILITSPVTTAYVDDTTITAGLTLSTQPDPIDAVRDGIPVPWILDSQEWNPAIRYVTGNLVIYDGQPFTALRASTGSIPPGNNVATTDWAPLSQSRRIRLCLSGYTSQDLSSGSSYSYAVTPFLEWYDAQGNFIARVFARSAAGNGTVSQPADMAYDSFTTESILSSAGVSAGTAALTPWNASFFNNVSLSGTPVLTRVDPSVNFTWDGAAPGPGVSASGWSASWVTSYTAPAAGSYGFQIQAAQGGSRLIVNGATVIDNWANQSAANLTATVTLTAGQVITVEADYWNPAAAQGSYSQDLLTISTANIEALYTKGQFPDSWTLYDHISYTSTQLPITPGETITIAGEIMASQQAQPVMTVTWQDGSGSPVSTSAVTYQGGGNTVGSTFTAPAGTVTATVSFSVEGSPLIYESGTVAPRVLAVVTGVVVTTQALAGAANPDALTVGTVSVPAIPGSATQFSQSLAGRLTDDEQSNWSVPAGAWTVGGFAGGSVWPTAPGTQSIGLITTQPASTSLGVTYRSLPEGGAYAGIVFRYASTSSYWRCDQNQLGYVTGGVYILIAPHSSAFQAGDRMTITLNSTAITVYRNGTQVNSATSSFNAAATSHGIINDVIASTEAKAEASNRRPVRQHRRMPPPRGRHHSTAAGPNIGIYGDTYSDGY